MTRPLMAVRSKPYEMIMYTSPTIEHPNTMSWYLPLERREYIMRALGSRYPESTYSPSKGRTTHVRANVSQYAILHVTKTARSGSQIPFEDSPSLRVLEAMSMGRR